MNNKTTLFILLATIVVSLGGTIMTVNKLSNMNEPRQITGFATSDSGRGRILIAKQVSLVVNTSVDALGGNNFHDDVNFGSCVPFFGHNINITSNSSNTADGNNGNCTGSAFPDYIHVYNTGNVDANVTIQSDVNNTGFITSAGDLALFGYKTTDGDIGPNNGTESYLGGCRKCAKTTICAGNAEANVSNWVNFAVTDKEYYACQNLTWSSSGTKPSFRTYLFVQIPPNAQSSGEIIATLTYTARDIS